jgi:hypothetical protein
MAIFPCQPLDLRTNQPRRPSSGDVCLRQLMDSALESDVLLLGKMYPNLYL